MAKTKKKQRIGVFYMSALQGPGGQPVSVGHLKFPPDVVYVRCEVSEQKTLEDALDYASPRRGETVMNSHYI